MRLSLLLFCATSVLLAAMPLRANEGPKTAVMQTVDRVRETLGDPAYKGADKEAALKEKLSEIIRQRFDLDSMAALSLGPYRRKFNEDQLERFSKTFGELLEATYLDRLTQAGDTEVDFTNTRLRGKQKAQVYSVVHAKEGDVPMVYSLHNQTGEWMVYDIQIEGVGLVSNYRQQFREMLLKNSPEEVIAKIQEKVEQQRQADDKEEK